MRSLGFLLLFLLFRLGTSQRWNFPPPKVLLAQHEDCVSGEGVEENPRLNCHGGQFVVSMGYCIPCRAHKHCYGAREPPSWCSNVANYNWTTFGCHCDPKIGSCLVERYQELGKNLEWSYCIPNQEFYCASAAPTFRTPTVVTPTTRSPVRRPTAPPRTASTIENLITSLDRK